MRKIFLIVSLLFLTSITSYSQNEATDSSIQKATEFMKSKGFKVEEKGSQIIASSGEEIYEVSIVTLANVPMPVLNISTELRSFSCPKNNPLSCYKFVNEGNLTIPFYKFTLGETQAGGLALVKEDLDEFDVIGVTVYGTFTTLCPEEHILFTLEDSLNTFRNIRTNMPENL